MDNDAAARTAVADEVADAALTGGPTDFTVVVRSQPDPNQYAMLTVLRQQAALSAAVTDLGGDPAQVAEQLARATVKIEALDPAPERDGGQIAAGYVAGILLFLALQTTAQLVSQGVVEEKSTRVVELLLSTIRPWQLMAGKVTGIGVIGLLQVVAVIAAAAGTALALGLLDTSSLDLGATIAWALVWFVVGFITYSLALAALASLVSRQEDVASVTAPVLVLMIIPYVIGISIAPWDPTNPVVVCAQLHPLRRTHGDADADSARLRRDVGDHRVPRALPGRDPGTRVGCRPDLLERRASHRRPGAPARGTPRRVTARAPERGPGQDPRRSALPGSPQQQCPASARGGHNSQPRSCLPCAATLSTRSHRRSKSGRHPP